MKRSIKSRHAEVGAGLAGAQNDNTEFHISDNERKYLRELAKKQLEYAALPIMAKRKKMWFDLNDGCKGARPLFIVEAGLPAGFERDFMPEGILRCSTKDGRAVEDQLLRNIRNHELINDDKVIPDTFTVNWFTDIDEFGVKIGQETVKDSQGVEAGYRFLHPVKNLKEDFHLLRPAICKVDKERTMLWKAFIEDLLGDILNVDIQVALATFRTTQLTRRANEIMGLEELFIAMCETPDEVHQLMAYLRDNGLRILRWFESNGLLQLNNGNQISFGSSPNFTASLPAPDHKENAVRLCDIWGASNSQETVSVSPDMFHEFCFPYYRDVCEPLGLLYYGCCEPVHRVWDDIRQLPHLKKVSISPWCDQHFMGEALQGTDIVFSRKPDPKFLGIEVKLDEEAWADHIRETLGATHGVNVEFIVRDVYTVHGNVGKARRAVEIARREIQSFYGAMT
jgi:hypothetical protein